MRPSISKIPIDPSFLIPLRNSRIAEAFINALPPRAGNLHGTSVEFFFEGGGSCSFDGTIIDIGPKQEAYSLRIGQAMGIDVWRNRRLAGTHQSVIETVELHLMWSRLGLDPLLCGPREVQFYRRAVSGGRCELEGKSRFEGVRLYIPGFEGQSLLLYASEDFPGDVVVMSGDQAAAFTGLIEIEIEATVLPSDPE